MSRCSSRASLSRCSSRTSMNSMYMTTSSYDEGDMLCNSIALFDSKRLDSIDLSALLLSEKDGNLSDTEIRPEASVYSGFYDSSDDELDDGDGDIDAWNVLKDDYAVAYGYGNTLPFRIFGTSADDITSKPHVLSPPLMESLQAFFPYVVSEDNFWMKFSLVRDGSSLPTLLQQVRGAKYTLMAIETVDGEVFGSFTSTPWKRQPNFFGSGEAFLWRMRKPRRSGNIHSIIDQAQLESELDVYPWSGKNYCVQLLHSDKLAVGSGEVEGNEHSNGISCDASPIEKKPSFNSGFGLSLDADLLQGTSGPCATFENAPLAQLCEDGVFEVANLEVWTLTVSSSEEDAERMELSNLFFQDNLQ